MMPNERGELYLNVIMIRPKNYETLNISSCVAELVKISSHTMVAIMQRSSYDIIRYQS